MTLVVLVLAVLAGAVVGLAPAFLLHWWSDRRERRRDALARQLRKLERAIWEESLPDWQREALAAHRQHAREIRREAWRRLGLPEEEVSDGPGSL